jgi:hypothetical protein
MTNLYEVRGDHAVIFVATKGRILETKVDIDTLEKLIPLSYTWNLQLTSKGEYPYVVTCSRLIPRNVVRGTMLHRLVANAPSHLITDHINLDSLDNRSANLRNITKRQNQLNNKSPNVHFNSARSKWVTSIGVRGKCVWLGAFDAEAEAKAAYFGARFAMDAVESITHGTQSLAEITTEVAHD